jgi:hypothetical protein
MVKYNKLEKLCYWSPTCENSINLEYEVDNLSEAEAEKITAPIYEMQCSFKRDLFHTCVWAQQTFSTPFDSTYVPEGRSGWHDLRALIQSVAALERADYLNPSNSVAPEVAGATELDEYFRQRQLRGAGEGAGGSYSLAGAGAGAGSSGSYAPTASPAAVDQIMDAIQHASNFVDTADGSGSGTTGEHSCADEPLHWASNYGTNCSQYVKLAYCTTSGGYGIGWEADWGAFDVYSSTSGIDSSQACCGCGGGSTGDVSHEALTPAELKTKAVHGYLRHAKDYVANLDQNSNDYLTEVEDFPNLGIDQLGNASKEHSAFTSADTGKCDAIYLCWITILPHLYLAPASPSVLR